MNSALLSLICAGGFVGVVGLLLWFLLKEAEKYGQVETQARETKETADALTKANNKADLADLMSPDQQLQYLKGRGRVRSPTDFGKPQ